MSVQIHVIPNRHTPEIEIDLAAKHPDGTDQIEQFVRFCESLIFSRSNQLHHGTSVYELTDFSDNSKLFDDAGKVSRRILRLKWTMV